MKKSVYLGSFFLFFFILSFLNGCSKNEAHLKKINEPKWLKDGKVEGKISGIGCAAIHYKGLEAQKKLAIQRAIDQIAMQVSTNVSTISYNERKRDSQGYSSNTQTKSLHTVNGENISTKILDWYKNSNGDICVLIIKE